MAVSSGDVARILTCVDSYIAPALLPAPSTFLSGPPSFDFKWHCDVIFEYFSSGNEWNRDQPSDRFTFWFSVYRNISTRRNALHWEEMKKFGYLPKGIYECMLSHIAAWNEPHSRVSPTLSSHVSVFCTRGQRFRLVMDESTHVLHVDVGNGSPLPLLARLTEIVKQVMLTMMKCLHVSTWVHSSEHNLFLSLGSVQDSLTSGSALIDDDVRAPIDFECLKRELHVWRSPDALLDHYDIFISYRWTKKEDIDESIRDYVVKYGDTSLAQAIFNDLRHRTVTPQRRAIAVFRDQQCLQMGMNFLDIFCRCLLHSTMVVPIMSDFALDRMRQHDATEVDYTLLEWIIALVLFKPAGTGICPIIVGKCHIDVTVDNGKRAKFEFGKDWKADDFPGSYAFLVVFIISCAFLLSLSPVYTLSLSLYRAHSFCCHHLAIYMAMLLISSRIAIPEQVPHRLIC